MNNNLEKAMMNRILNIINIIIFEFNYYIWNQQCGVVQAVKLTQCTSPTRFGLTFILIKMSSYYVKSNIGVRHSHKHKHLHLHSYVIELVVSLPLLRYAALFHWASEQRTRNSATHQIFTTLYFDWTASFLFWRWPFLHFCNFPAWEIA